MDRVNPEVEFRPEGVSCTSHKRPVKMAKADTRKGGAVAAPHAQSRSLLLGDNPTDAEVPRRSAEHHVDADTPPMFIVHCFDDGAVPI